MSTIPDILGLGQIIVDLLASLGINVSLSSVNIVILTVVLLIVLVFLISTSVKIWDWYIRPRREREQYIQNALGVEFRDKIHPQIYKRYIKTQFQNVPPNNYEDPRQSLGGIASADLIEFYLKSVFTTENINNDMYCILAGSGMGKTTFLVHLFCEYVRKYKPSKRPFDIVLIPLSNENAIERIGEVSKPESTILLLDALDESTEAVDHFEDYINKLENAIARFRFVVLSCRTQFFENEKAELQQSRLRSLGDEKGFKIYTRHYIAPWSDEDIDKYLTKSFGKWGRRRKKANAILKSCRDVMVRPLLLSYIKDLVASDNLLNDAVDIYEALIQKWIDREVNGLPNVDERKKAREQLAQLSRLLAVNIYQNRTVRSGLYIPREDFKEFCKQNGFVGNYPFKQRSLINRDSRGDLKFAHKSFLEFFLAQERSQNPDFELRFEGMDMGRRFYKELVNKKLLRYKNDGICDLTIYPESIMLDNIHREPVYTLNIYKDCNVNYNDIATAFPIVRVSVNADAVNNGLREWLSISNISVINIIQSSRLKGQLGFLFKIPKLELIEIDEDQDGLSNNFMQNVLSRRLSLCCKGKLVIQGNLNNSWTSLAIFMGMRRNQQDLIIRFTNKQNRKGVKK